MAHDVFISYAARDKAIADAVCATLERRRIRCWIAPRDVLPGRPFPEALIDAINHSRLLVLVFSSGSNESPQVMREVERAVSKGLPIIPLRIEDVPLSPAMEYFISAPHWLDALTPPLEAHLERLADTVEALFAVGAGEGAGGQEAPAPPPPSPAPRQARRSLPTALLLLGALAAGVLLGLALSRRAAPAPQPAATSTQRAALPTPAAAAAGLPVTAEAAAATAATAAAAVATEMAGGAPLTTAASFPTRLPPPENPPPGTPGPPPTYRLPFPGPEGLASDGTQLWARFGQRLVRLEEVAGEGRMRAAEEREAPAGRGLAWDATRQGYWAVQGPEVALLDREWRPVAAYALPEALQVNCLAAGEACLWAGTGDGPLYKLQPDDGAHTLEVVDSYAAPPGEFTHRAVNGLAWDGDRLWVLVDNVLSALDATGRPAARVKLPSGGQQFSWYGWRGLAWDGCYLWAAHGEADVVCRVDPGVCR